MIVDRHGVASPNDVDIYSIRNKPRRRGPRGPSYRVEQRKSTSYLQHCIKKLSILDSQDPTFNMLETKHYEFYDSQAKFLQWRQLSY